MDRKPVSGKHNIPKIPSNTLNNSLPTITPLNHFSSLPPINLPSLSTPANNNLPPLNLPLTSMPQDLQSTQVKLPNLTPNNPLPEIPKVKSPTRSPKSKKKREKSNIARQLPPKPPTQSRKPPKSRNCRLPAGSGQLTANDEIRTLW